MDNSENLIDEQLSQIKIAKIYKERLKEFKAKCTKRMESDFLAQIELQLKSRIQFKTPKITGFQDYKNACSESLKLYFDPQAVVSRANLDFIHKSWTLNFSDAPGPNQIPDIQQVIERIRTLAT